MSEQDKVAEDTGLSEATETSNDDVDLEDIEISFEDEQDNSESEKEEAATESEEEEQSEDKEEEESEEQSEEEPEEKAEEENTDSEAERKRFNDEMAKQRIAEREAREQARLAREELEKERLDAYLAEAQNDAEEYARREINIEAYKLQQEKATLNAERLQVGIDKAMANIDLFRTGSPAVKEELLSALDEFEAYNVTKDKAGNYIEVKGDVYQYLQKKAESIKRLTQEGAVNEAKSKEKTKAKTFALPSRKPKEAKADPDLEGFDEEANRW